MSLETWVFRRLPGFLRRPLAEKRIRAWLMEHGLTRGQAMQAMSGYRTRVAAAGAVFAGVAGIIHGYQAGNNEEVLTGITALSGALGALGMRFDLAKSAAVGGLGVIASGLGMAATGIVHDWNFGEILAGLTIANGGLAMLGINFSARAAQAREIRIEKGIAP